MQIAQKKITKFQKEILDWYAQNQRKLPWREMPVGTSLQQRAYRILISEVMSQQTQILRVIPKYHAWLAAFPTIEDLATAKVSDVLQHWSGLGYNRRALNLKKTAEMIVKDYGGKFPQEEKTLRRLPGIGEYTARAILCFAFDEQVAVVDTNVRKVILTQFSQRHREERSDVAISHEIASSLRGLAMTEKEIEEVAERLLPIGKAYEWNQALMDYAAAMLKKEKIPIPKQSKFIGSHRYYRGQVLKLLLQKKHVLIKEVGPLIKKDYTVSEGQWLHRLLEELQDEGFIVIEKDSIHLS